MALRSIFKKKKLPEEKKDYYPPTTRGAFKEGGGGVGVPLKRAPIERPIEKQKEIKEEMVAVPKREKKKVVGEAYRILKTPHATEKAADLAEKNQYVFKVWPRVNKTEIGKAIEDIYGVDVLSVRIIKVPRKQKEVGKSPRLEKGIQKSNCQNKGGTKNRNNAKIN